MFFSFFKSVYRSLQLNRSVTEPCQQTEAAMGVEGRMSLECHVKRIRYSECTWVAAIFCFSCSCCFFFSFFFFALTSFKKQVTHKGLHCMCGV